MYLIRILEDVIKEYAANGTIPGFVHLSTGQEACQAGVVRALRTTDYKYPDHRGHGAILLCGTDPKYVMAEIFGKATGVNGGRGGSMHVHDWSCHNHGFNGIQGSTVVTALGTAFAGQKPHTTTVSAVFMATGNARRRHLPRKHEQCVHVEAPNRLYLPIKQRPTHLHPLPHRAPARKNCASGGWFTACLPGAWTAMTSKPS